VVYKLRNKIIKILKYPVGEILVVIGVVTRFSVNANINRSSYITNCLGLAWLILRFTLRKKKEERRKP
jgi:hypothetical protein